MSKQRADTPAEPLAEQSEAPAAIPGIPARRFRDTRYLSRTLVLEDGRIAQVENSEIAAIDADWIAHLQQNPEFEPIE
ncbi:hypothetical protein ACIPK7_06285 [Pseudomonas sp. NPDC086581]|uniref:hypothetical protein n=1 Tax=Pseudomonas sp. NPDC086581 TaxID=3364432 RepID=UPI00382844B1